MNKSANDKISVASDRPPGPGRTVDPATRLSELLAQSLEELTRPFDPTPPQSEVPAGPNVKTEPALQLVTTPAQPATKPAEAGTPLSGDDSDRALAELEAELFTATQKAARERVMRPVPQDLETPKPDAPAPKDPDKPAGDQPGPVGIAAAPAITPPVKEAAPAPTQADADAERLIARVRRLMLVSMMITLIAIGSVFGFIGYRVFKGEGSVEKKADKVPEAAPVALPADMTLVLPRGARVVQSAVVGERLVITIDVNGKLEVRTFDIATLQPAGRLNFSVTP
jgi:hypothetical protein